MQEVGVLDRQITNFQTRDEMEQDIGAIVCTMPAASATTYFVAMGEEQGCIVKQREHLQGP